MTTLRYQTIDDMVEAIGLPKEKLCLYCWNGEYPQPKRQAGEKKAANKSVVEEASAAKKSVVEEASASKKSVVEEASASKKSAAEETVLSKQ